MLTMNKKNIIYTLTTFLALALGSCASEDFWDTFDRTVDGPIDFTVGVESSPAERSLTRAITPTYTSMSKGTQVRIRVNGNWVKKTPNTTVSQTATCVTNEASEVNSLSYDNNTLYWDDYGAGDPDNSTNTANGLTVLGVAIDGKNAAPAVGDDQWDNLPWTVVTDGKDVLKSDIIISNNLTTSPYTFAKRNDDNAKKMIFTHPLSKITFNITASNGFVVNDVNGFQNDPELTLTSAPKLSDINTPAYHYAKTSGTINIENATATADGNVSKVIATTVETDGAKVKKEALVYPTTLLGADDNSIIAQLKVDGNIYYIRAAQIHAVMPSGDYATKPGYNYVINIVLSKTHIGVTATVEDWTSVSSSDINALIDITGNLGSTVTSLTDKFDMFTLYRCADINKGYNSLASTLSKPDDVSEEWISTPKMYWPDHDTHYHFRGVFPTETTVVADATSDYIDIKNNCNGNLLVGRPDIPANTPCGSTDHTPVADMNVDGICAREGKINLEFKYMMSEIEVNLTSSAVDALDYVKLESGKVTVHLVNAYTAGKLLLSDLSVDPTGERTTDALENKGSLKFQSYIIPQALTFTKDDKTEYLQFKISVQNDDDTYDYYYASVEPIFELGKTTKIAPNGKWESGIHYVYNLKITKTEIKATATLKGWETVTAEQEVWF